MTKIPGTRTKKIYAESCRNRTCNGRCGAAVTFCQHYDWGICRKPRVVLGTVKVRR